MSINDLTLGQIKELQGLFLGDAKSDDNFTPHIGKICIIRTYASGVFMGKLQKQSGRMVELQGARRLWSWKAKEGISLSAVAVAGVDPKQSRFPQPVPSITILDALEIIPASDACISSVDATPVSEQV